MMVLQLLAKESLSFDLGYGDIGTIFDKQAKRRDGDWDRPLK